MSQRLLAQDHSHLAALPLGSEQGKLGSWHPRQDLSLPIRRVGCWALALRVWGAGRGPELWQSPAGPSGRWSSCYGASPAGLGCWRCCLGKLRLRVVEDPGPPWVPQALTLCPVAFSAMVSPARPQALALPMSQSSTSQGPRSAWGSPCAAVRGWAGALGHPPHPLVLGFLEAKRGPSCTQLAEGGGREPEKAVSPPAPAEGPLCPSEPRAGLAGGPPHPQTPSCHLALSFLRERGGAAHIPLHAAPPHSCLPDPAAPRGPWRPPPCTCLRLGVQRAAAPFRQCLGTLDKGGCREAAPPPPPGLPVRLRECPRVPNTQSGFRNAGEWGGEPGGSRRRKSSWAVGTGGPGRGAGCPSCPHPAPRVAGSLPQRGRLYLLLRVPGVTTM